MRHKKSVVRIGFLLKEPCNIDRLTAIQDVTAPQEAGTERGWGGGGTRNQPVGLSSRTFASKVWLSI